VALYETVAKPLSREQQEAVRSTDYVTFTSSSTVRFLLESLGDPHLLDRMVSIGPVTSTTLRSHALEPDVEAERHDIDGLVEALIRDTTTSVSR